MTPVLELPDGIRAFLATRGIALAEGSLDESSPAHTVTSIGRRKNDLIQRLMTQRGVAPYAGSVRFLAAVGEAGPLRAVVTSSGLAGKPAPDAFLEAARRLGVAPSHAAVFEDALAGVAAGHAGHFGLVVGVDRAGDADGLRAAGADVVVEDLDELLSRR